MRFVRSKTADQRCKILNVAIKSFFIEGIFTCSKSAQLAMFAINRDDLFAANVELGVAKYGTAAIDYLRKVSSLYRFLYGKYIRAICLH